MANNIDLDSLIIDGKLDLTDRQFEVSELVAITNSPAMSGVVEFVLNGFYGKDIGDAGAKAIANSQTLSKLTSLDLSRNHIGEAGAQALADSQTLSRLTSLDLGDNNIGAEGAKAIADSQNLSELISLDLDRNEIGDTGAKALANSQNLSKLTSIGLSRNHIGDVGAKAIANSQNLSNLTSLDLSYNGLSIGGAKALAYSQTLSNLTSLDLSDNQIGVAGVQAIVDSQSFSNLTTLILGGNKIGDEGTKALANSQILSNLISLNLGSNGIGVEGAKAIANSQTLSKLTSLKLHYNYIEDKGAKAIADSQTFSNLTTLVLSGNKIGDEGTKALANSQILSNLTSLDLRNTDLRNTDFSNNHIGDAGAKALANSQILSKLTYLNLQGNGIGDEGTKAIADSQTLSNLTSLDLRCNHIGAEGAKAIADSQTLSNLISLNLELNGISDKGAKSLADSQTLSKLTSLCLQGNRIVDAGVRALATSETLAGLTWLNLGSNKTSDIPLRLLDDIKALRRHFQLQQTETEQVLPIARAMIIGQPGVGKSTLFRALDQQPLNLGKLPRTHGVERARIRVKVQPDQQPELDVKLNLMDFGGQRLQMMVHSLFFGDKGIYLLVINQDTKPEDIAFWLDNIQGVVTDRDNVRILPVRNPSVDRNATPLSLHQLAPQARQQFHLANEITLNIQTPSPRNGSDSGDYSGNNGGDHIGDNSNADSREASASTANIIDTLRYELASFPFRTGFEVHIRIAEYIEENLATLFPEPFYSISAFDQLLKRDQTINQLLSDTLQRAGKSDELGQYRKDISVYLDYMGVLTRLETTQTRESQQTTGYIIIAPELVQHGLYCVFPPEDALRDKNSALTTFYQRMTTTHEGQRLVGCFSKQEFALLAREAFQQAIRDHGDADQFTHDLLQILCHRKLGLIIPLHTGHYLVPAYIEETHPYDALTQAKQVLSSWSRSQHVYVIELANSQETIAFPSYFLYKLMVHCRQDSQQAAISYSQEGVFTDIESVRTQRCLLRWARYPSVYVELVGYQGKIWCLGFSEDPEYSGEIEDLIKAVYDGLNRFYYYISDSTGLSISRSIPCPKCLDKLASASEDPSESTEQNQADITTSLNKIFLFRNDELMTMLEKHPSKRLRCGSNPSHVFSPFQLKDDLSRRHQAGLSSVPLSDHISKSDLRSYIVTIYEFLHDQGLSSLTDKGSSDALPNLFPGGTIGTTDKTMAKLVRWHYGKNDLNDGKRPPSDTVCEQAIAHLVIRIPIFRHWAEITTASQNVQAAQYYEQIKQVALGLQNHPEPYLQHWASVFPNAEKRAVKQKLRDKH